MRRERGGEAMTLEEYGRCYINPKGPIAKMYTDWKSDHERLQALANEGYRQGVEASMKVIKSIDFLNKTKLFPSTAWKIADYLEHKLLAEREGRKG
jgi:hypothetical protein